MSERIVNFKTAATKAKQKQKVTIKTTAMIRDGQKMKPLTITVHRTGAIEIRPLKRHKSESISAAVAYYIAVQRRVAHERATKQAAKKAVKK